LQIARRGFEVGVAEQNLNRSEINASFEQVGGEGVPQGLLILLMNCTQLGFAIGGIRSMAQKLK
jgi:hypothetical protein